MPRRRPSRASSELRRSFHQLTVIMADLQIAMHLHDVPGFEAVLAGGIVRPCLYPVVGPIVERVLESLRADITFAGAGAVDDEGDRPNATGTPPERLAAMAFIAGEFIEVNGGAAAV